MEEDVRKESSLEAPWYGLPGKPVFRVMANKALAQPLTNLHEKIRRTTRKRY